MNPDERKAMLHERLGFHIERGILWVGAHLTRTASQHEIALWDAFNVAEQRPERAEEWRDSILGLLKTYPEFNQGSWGGIEGPSDLRDGWGFCFEFIKWMVASREVHLAEAVRLLERTTKQCEYHLDPVGKPGSIRPDWLIEARKFLSSTPADSLARVRLLQQVPEALRIILLNHPDALDCLSFEWQSDMRQLAASEEKK